MAETVIVTTFSQDSRAYEALARLAERDDDTDTELRRHRREVTAAKVEAKQTAMRKRLGHLVHH
jgi:hypothetical protein